MLELHVSNNNVTSGAIPVSWCVDREMLNHLSEKGVKDPALVLCVAPVNNYDSSKEVRKVVPLRDLMAYVDFRFPGEHRIWGFVSSKFSLREAKKYYLSKGGRDFIASILNWDGDGFTSHNELLDVKDPLMVVVPKDSFAPEPARWEKDWVNWLFLSKCVDQCHFRRRRMFAYTLQPLILLFNVLWRLLGLFIALLVGARNMSLKYVLHPLDYGLDISWKVIGGGTYFVTPFEEEWDSGLTNTQLILTVLKKCWKLPLMPAILLFMVKFNLLVPISLLLLALIVVVALSVFFGTGTAADMFSLLMEKLQSSDFWYLQQDEVDLLVCSGDPKTDLSKLPAKRRTVKLYYQDLKSKICKPFAR